MPKIAFFVMNEMRAVKQYVFYTPKPAFTIMICL